MNLEPPRFILARVYDDGHSETEIVPVTRIPLDTGMSRRGFLGAGITTAAVLSLLGCTSFTPKKKKSAAIRAHREAIESLAVTPDGHLLASAGGYDDGIKLWSLPDGNLLNTLENKSYISTLVATPDGRFLVSGSNDNIRLWSLPDGKLLKTLGNKGRNSLAMTSDGYLLIFGNDDDIKFWGLPEGNLLRTFKTLGNSVDTLVLTPNGRLLVSGDHFYNTCRIWSLTEGNLLKTLKNNIPFNSLAVTPNGQMFASGGYDGVKLWSLPDGKLLKTLGNKGGNSLAVTPDGRLLASGGSDSIELWSLPDGNLLKTLANKSSVKTLVTTPNGRLLISGSDDGTITFWSLPEGKSSYCLMDVAAMDDYEEGISYHASNEYGEEVIYSLPCGSIIPSGAICTCNCVSGTRPSPVPTPKSTYSGSYCTCNKVCTCVPVAVCQAYRLTHPDAIVRTMAEEILYLIGDSDFEYMNWAADNAKPPLQNRILDIIARINQGAKASPSRWSSVNDYIRYLTHPDEIIRIMAVQMLNQQHINGCSLSPDIQTKVLQLLTEAAQRPWFIRYNVSNWRKQYNTNSATCLTL